jgi:hypothetical protein
LAVLYITQGKYGKTEQLFSSSLVIFFKKLGEEHPTSWVVMNNYLKFLEQIFQTQPDALNNLLTSGSPMTRYLLEQLINGSL